MKKTSFKSRSAAIMAAWIVITNFITPIQAVSNHIVTEYEESEDNLLITPEWGLESNLEAASLDSSNISENQSTGEVMEKSGGVDEEQEIMADYLVEDRKQSEQEMEEEIIVQSPEKVELEVEQNDEASPFVRSAEDFSQLLEAIEEATSGVPTIINITESFSFESTINIDQEKDITIQADGDYILTQVNGRHFVIEDKATLTLKDGVTLYGNVQGGGVHVGSTGIFNMTGGVIRGNKGRDGTVRAIAGETGGVHVAGSFTMYSGDILENRGGKGYNTVSNFEGHNGGTGGVHVDEYGSFTMYNGSVVSDNTGGDGGEDISGFGGDGGVGGIGVSTGGKFTMNGGTISINRGGEGSRGRFMFSTGGTGGVHIAATGRFIMNDGAILGNIGGAGGGSIRPGGAGGVFVLGTFTFNEGAIHNNKGGTGRRLNVQNGSNVGDGGAGGTYIADGGIFNMGGKAAMYANIGGDSSFLSGSGGAGGVHVLGTFSMTGEASIYGNYGGEPSNGSGGVRVASNSGEVTMKEKTSIHGNNAGPNATGGVHVGAGTFTMIDDATIYDNKGTANASGVHIGSGTFTMEDKAAIYENRGIVDTNTVGGVRISDAGSFTMTDETTIRDNKGSNGNNAGVGGVFVAGEFNMKGKSAVSSNNAGSGGGAGAAGGVHVSGAFTMTDETTIRDNEGSDGGSPNSSGGAGGVHMTGGQVKITDTATIQGNTGGAGGSGSGADAAGGIHVQTLNQTNLQVSKDVEFSSNSAPSSSRPPFNVITAFPNIQTTSSSISDIYHPLNNFDIGYTSSNLSIRTLTVSRNIIGGSVMVDDEVILSRDEEEEMTLSHQIEVFGGDVDLRLVAEPSTGYRFAGWTATAGELDDAGNRQTVFTMPDENVTITANFEVSGPMPPVDPLDPDQEANPEHKPDLPNDQGPLSIDFISQLDFGTQKISSRPQPLYANPQRLLDIDEGVDPYRPNYIQISDQRRDDSVGWKLSVSQDTPFLTETGQELKGAQLTLQFGQVVTTSNNNSESPSSDQSPIGLIPNRPDADHVSHELVIAEPGKGQGTWVYRFGNDSEEAPFSEGVKLELLDSTLPQAVTYSTTLTWTLASVPLDVE